jgi:hypothetical protein
MGVGLFFRRFIGVLALDASMFEEIEADTHAWAQAAVVVIIAAAGARIAAIEIGLSELESFIIAAVVPLGGLIVWVTAVAALGRFAFAEPQTHSSVPELLRTLGFAAAPGVFLSLAVMRPAAPAIVGIVLIWMAATTVIAVRQSLDYVGTRRAVAVCVLSALISLGGIAALIALLARDVS